MKQLSYSVFSMTGGTGITTRNKCLLAAEEVITVEENSRTVSWKISKEKKIKKKAFSWYLLYFCGQVYNNRNLDFVEHLSYT